MRNIELSTLILLVLFFHEVVLQQTCPENQHYDQCGPAEGPNCEHPNRKPNSSDCYPGCYCNEGLFWDHEINECVTIEECPGVEPSSCKKNEIYKNCGPKCFATCSDPNNTCEGCVPGCVCRDGYIRDDRNDYICIHKSECGRI